MKHSVFKKNKYKETLIVGSAAVFFMFVPLSNGLLGYDARQNNTPQDSNQIKSQYYRPNRSSDLYNQNRNSNNPYNYNEPDSQQYYDQNPDAPVVPVVAPRVVPEIYPYNRNQGIYDPFPSSRQAESIYQSNQHR